MTLNTQAGAALRSRLVVATVAVLGVLALIAPAA
jgi:hypothetical protein